MLISFLFSQKYGVSVLHPCEEKERRREREEEEHREERVRER